MMKILNLTILLEHADINDTLSIFWKGMLAIFVAIGIIFITIVIMNYFTKLKENKNSKKTSENDSDGKFKN